MQHPHTSSAAISVVGPGSGLAAKGLDDYSSDDAVAGGYSGASSDEGMGESVCVWACVCVGGGGG